MPSAKGRTTREAGGNKRDPDAHGAVRRDEGARVGLRRDRGAQRRASARRRDSLCERQSGLRRRDHHHNDYRHDRAAVTRTRPHGAARLGATALRHGRPPNRTVPTALLPRSGPYPVPTFYALRAVATEFVVVATRSTPAIAAPAMFTALARARRRPWLPGMRIGPPPRCFAASARRSCARSRLHGHIYILLRTMIYVVRCTCRRHDSRLKQTAVASRLRI